MIYYSVLLMVVLLRPISSTAVVLPVSLPADRSVTNLTEKFSQTTVSLDPENEYKSDFTLKIP